MIKIYTDTGFVAVSFYHVWVRKQTVGLFRPK